jgi:putative SOS response-associated peptidase YedK
MCNLYSITTNQDAISALFRVVNRYVGNLAPMPGVFPDYKAPIVRTGADGRELATARWGMPSSAHALMKTTARRCSRQPEISIRLLQSGPARPKPSMLLQVIAAARHWARSPPDARCALGVNSADVQVWMPISERAPCYKALSIAA